MKPVVTLIAIADGSRARFYRNEGPGKGLVHVSEMNKDADVPPGRELKSDRPGRTFESATHGRSAYEPKSDPREMIEADFARTIADLIARELESGGADAVIICAAPATLGYMRKFMPKQVEAKLRATLDKDLTKIPVQELPQHLASVLAV